MTHLLAVGSSAAPLGVRAALLVPLVAIGALLAVVGRLGWQGRLSRQGRLGVRTPAALRSEEAFRLANRVAGPPAVVAGAVCVLGGVAAFSVPTTGATITAAVLGLLGGLAIAVAGGVLGGRAAATVPAGESVPAGCAGCACGGCAAAGNG